ncbi:MAG: DUF1572 family protein [candidate division KSB1 bacterium]|nr:DUF1572 family protein [candidate division KSB1 bacterium]
MNVFVGEYKRYKGLLENAVAQVSDEDFFRQIGETSNSIAIIVKHFARDRWQFLTIPPGKSAEYNQNPTMEKGT